MIPLLLLHGALGSKVQMEPLATRIHESGKEVFTMNFSGHGGEPFSKQGFSIPVFVDDVISFMDFHEVKKVDIFGYSMGGYVALLLATQHAHRIRSIITLGTKFDWSNDSAAHEVKKLNLERIIEKVPAFARTLELRHQPNDWKDLVSRTATLMMDLGEQPLLNERNLRMLNHSVLVALGDHDDTADQQYSLEVATWLNGQFRCLPNTPHALEKVDLNLLVKLIDEGALQKDP